MRKLRQDYQKKYDKLKTSKDKFEKNKKTKKIVFKPVNAVFGFIIGLGGRDVTLQDIGEIVDFALENDKPKEDIIWMGLKR